MHQGLIIGRLTEDADLLLQEQQPEPWQLYSFRLSTDELSFHELPDSCYSSPGRYLYELFIRLREKQALHPLLIINPCFDFSRLQLLRILYFVRTGVSLEKCQIIADEKGRPLAYLLAEDTSPDFCISLISTVDAALDAALLAQILSTTVDVTVLPKSGGTYPRYTRLPTAALVGIYQWIGKNALDTLRDHPTSPRPGITGIMPYHAGDALFLARALSMTQHALEGIAICSSYTDILANHAPQISITSIELPAPYRDGWAISEQGHFELFSKQLPTARLYTYLRPSGDYNRTQLHLIDHFAFAVGATPRSAGDLVWAHPGPQRLTVPPSPPPRILLHFDAGWSLKVYPITYQSTLIDALLGLGYEVTVLGKTNEECDGYKQVRFTNYAALVSLLEQQHLVVGMDSFPAHLCTHAMGIPTICLFGSTRPENSNAPASSRYRHLEAGLSCRPCYSLENCPRFGGRDCHNFVAPEVVVENIQELLHRQGEIPDFKAEADIKTKQAPVESRNKLQQRAKTINLDHLPTAIIIEHFHPRNYQGSAGAQMLKEFYFVFRTQGINKALTKTFHFLKSRLFR